MQRPLVKSLLLCAVLTTSGAMLSGCNSVDASSNSKKKEEVIAIPVETAKLTHGDISSNYATTAVLEAKEEAFVVARASGIIHEIMVEEGDYVKKGQVLAKLEPERYRLALVSAQANLVGVEEQLNKVKDMYSKKLASADTYDKLVAQYKGAKAAVDLAKLDLQETTIRAPISGYIAERNAKVGNLTESFQRERMFHIVQQNELYGIVYLPEKELSKVHKGQKATLDLTALNNDIVKAHVERISPVIDAKSGTFKVTLTVPNADKRLKAGMFAQVKLNFDTRKNVILMPRKALLDIDDKLNVFVVKKGVATKTPVTIGYQDGGMVQITSGLKGDEQVVVTGHHNLKDHAKVEVVNS